MPPRPMISLNGGGDPYGQNGIRLYALFSVIAPSAFLSRHTPMGRKREFTLRPLAPVRTCTLLFSSLASTIDIRNDLGTFLLLKATGLQHQAYGFLLPFHKPVTREPKCDLVRSAFDVSLTSSGKYRA